MSALCVSVSIHSKRWMQPVVTTDDILFTCTQTVLHAQNFSLATLSKKHGSRQTSIEDSGRNGGLGAEEWMVEM